LCPEEVWAGHPVALSDDWDEVPTIVQPPPPDVVPTPKVAVPPVLYTKSLEKPLEVVE
jgi:hypothetical protein